MKSIIILPKSERGFFISCSHLLADPFYYLMKLDSLVFVLFAAVFIVSLLACFMMGIWMLVKFITLGIVHKISDVPVKMFFGMSVITIFSTLAGIIHRHLTRSEFRGRFISFSDFITLQNCETNYFFEDRETFVFQVVDKRATQLIGISICAHVIIDHGRGDFEFRAIPIQSPGLIVLPTQIPVPLKSIFPELLNANCHICGAECTVATVAAHLEYYHEIDKQGSTEKRKINMHRLISSIHEIRIRISGVDEVSAKAGTAEHIYEKTNICFNGEKKGEDDFDTVTTSIDEGSLPTISSGSLKNFIHVDFNYN